MATPDLIFYLHKPKRVIKYDAKGVKYQDQIFNVLDLPFKNYEEKVFQETNFTCKTCPYFSISPHKSVWGKCTSKYGHGSTSKKTSDKNRCHPEYRKLIKFHCSGCGTEGKHKSLLIKEFGCSKYFRVFLCQSCLKKITRFYCIKSYYRFLRNKFINDKFKSIEDISLKNISMWGDFDHLKKHWSDNK